MGVFTSASSILSPAFYLSSEAHASRFAYRDPLNSEIYLFGGICKNPQLLVTSEQNQGITLRGPTRPTGGWQTQIEDAYTVDQFEIDWECQRVYCPQGKASIRWYEGLEPDGSPSIRVRFSQRDCRDCHVRALCTRNQHNGRSVYFPPRPQYEALQAARAWYASEEGREVYQRRAGVEGSLSQGVRAFGMRRTRYRGLDKTHFQSIAIAAAMNLDRLVAWFDERPRAKTRTSRFARLAPPHAMGPA